MCCWCCCKCCEHSILFCDRDAPCNIDFIPQTKQEEDDFDGIDPDDLEGQKVKRGECRRRWKWRLKRSCVRCCTLYWRKDPCACLEGSPSGTCYLRHKPTPWCGLMILSLTKMTTFLVFGVLYFLEAYENYFIAFPAASRERTVLRGEEWMDPDGSRRILRKIEQNRQLHLFIMNATSTLLFSIHAVLYFMILLATCCRYLVCGFCFLLMWLIPALCVIYQPLHFHVTPHDHFQIPRNYSAIVAAKAHSLDESNFYRWELYLIWGISLVLVPYEIWLLIWRMRNVKVQRLKRLGYIVEDSTEFLVDAIEPKTGEVFLVEEPDAVFLAGQELMLGNRSLTEFELRVDSAEIEPKNQHAPRKSIKFKK